MGLKNFFHSLFSYKPNKEYDFDLSMYPEENTKSDNYINKEEVDKVKTDFSKS